MRVWKVCIRPDPVAPDLAQGYVLAADKKDAFATVDHPDAEVFEAEPAMPWLGHAGERIVWVTRPLAVSVRSDRSDGVSVVSARSTRP